MVWPARAATCNRVLITSAGVTSEAAGIPARKDSTFAVGSLSHCVKVTVPRTARRGKKVKAGIESKSLFAVASGKRSCDSRLQAGGSNTPNGATPRLSFPRPPTSACYAYILTQSRGIIDQHNFKWLKTNGREIWGFVRLLYFWLFFFFLLSCWNQSYWVWFSRGEACYPFPLPASLRLLAVSGGASSHTFNHSHPPNPNLSGYTRRLYW